MRGRYGFGEDVRAKVAEADRLAAVEPPRVPDKRIDVGGEPALGIERRRESDALVNGEPVAGCGVLLREMGTMAKDRPGIKTGVRERLEGFVEGCKSSVLLICGEAGLLFGSASDDCGLAVAAGTAAPDESSERAQSIRSDQNSNRGTRAARHSSPAAIS